MSPSMLELGPVKSMILEEGHYHPTLPNLFPQEVLSKVETETLEYP